MEHIFQISCTSWSLLRVVIYLSAHLNRCLCCSYVPVQRTPAGVIREQLAKVFITTETLCRECAMCRLNADESSSDQRAFHSQGCYKHNHTMLCVGPRHSYPLQPRRIHPDGENYTIRAWAQVRPTGFIQCRNSQWCDALVCKTGSVFAHKDGGVASGIRFRQVSSCTKLQALVWYGVSSDAVGGCVRACARACSLFCLLVAGWIVNW